MFNNTNIILFVNASCKHLHLRELCSSQKLFENVKNSVNLDHKSCRNDVKPLESVPGPKSVPVLGYLWHLGPFGKYYKMPIHKMHIQLQKEYGNLVLLRDLKVSDDLLLCYDPKDIETIFRNEGPWPRRDIFSSIKHYREKMRKDIYMGYEGVFASDNEKWQAGRSVANSLMMQPRVAKQYVKRMAEVSQDFVERIKYLTSQDPNGEMPKDFSNDLNKWAMESVGMLTMDTRFGCLSPNIDPNSEAQKFINDVANAFDLMYEIEILPSLSKYMWTPKWKRYISAFDNITYFVQKRLNEVKAKIAADTTEKHVNEMSIIEKLIKNHDPKYAFSTIMDILFAGVDTSSKTMAAILFNLSTNPEAQEKLRKEVRNVFPDIDTPVTMDKLESMPYLRAVIKESMRLTPIAFGITRKTSKDLVLSEYLVPKGTHVLIEQMALYWSDEHFSEAQKFRPERWLRSESKKGVDTNPWVYLPFGFGPRSCVGRRLAQLEIEILTAKIVRNFRMEWHHGEMTYTMALFFGLGSPLKIRMIPDKS